MVKFTSILSTALLATAALGDVVDLTGDNFESSIEAKDFSVVKFFAPWCGHCKKMAPDWIEAGKSLNGEDGVLVGNVDCTVEKDLCKKFGVKGYPTLKSFKKGVEQEGVQVPRSHGGVINFVNKNAGTNVAVPEGSQPKPAAKSQDPFPDTYVAGANHKVVSTNFKDLVLDSDKHVFIKIFAPWCGHCKKMAPDWEIFAKNLEDQYDDVVIAEYDATANSVPPAYSIKGYPTVFWAEKGKKGEPEKYTGARTLPAWTDFVAKKLAAPVEDAKADGKDEL